MTWGSVNTSRLRVGILTKHDLRSRNAWSGIPFYMCASLARLDIDVVPLAQPGRIGRWWRRRGKGRLRFGSGEYHEHYRRVAARVAKDLRRHPCDVVLAVVASGELAHIPDLPPIIYTTDATPRALLRLYRHAFTDAEQRTRDEEELSAIQRASRIVYPSQWAADSAMRDYGCAPGKISVIPYGANTDDTPSREGVLALDRDMTRCRLLFIGKDWERKGGSIACDTLRCLRQQGVDAELWIVGCRPLCPVGDGVHVVPYLDKNKQTDAERFRELLKSSHFLLFPTRGECYGIVTCEANAYGLPVIASEVGGITTTIRPGRNGLTLPLEAGGDAYARRIAAIFKNERKYRELSLSARNEYDDRLNWSHWATGVRDLVYQIAGRRQPVSSPSHWAGTGTPASDCSRRQRYPLNRDRPGSARMSWSRRP